MLHFSPLPQTDETSPRISIPPSNNLTGDFELVQGHENSSGPSHLERPSLLPEDPFDTKIQISTGNQGSSDNSNGSFLTLVKQACFLRKVCAVLISIIIWTLLIGDEEDKDDRLENLFFVACFFLIYVVFENIVFLLRQDLSIIDYEEVTFDLLDCFLGFCFMIGIFAKNSENLNKYLLIASTCSCLILTGLYVRKFNVASIRNLKIPRKIACAIQIALITGKNLEYISFNWTLIFLPVGLYLAFQLIYGLYTVIKLVVHFYRAVRSGEIDNSYWITAIIVISWLILFYGLNALFFGILAQFSGKQTEEWIRTILMGVEYYCCFFFGYTLVFFKFFSDLGIDFSQNIEINSPNPLKSRSQIKGLSMKQTKKLVMAHFSKLSRTYFSKIEGDSEEEGENIAIGNEEHSCYICETDQPDIILMGCGHGGMCKGCVLMSIRKNNACMECRAPIQDIYQIEKEEKEKGRVKAWQIFTII